MMRNSKLIFSGYRRSKTFGKFVLIVQFYLMFPICEKKDLENFLILCMVVVFPLTILSRANRVILGIAHPAQ